MVYDGQVLIPTLIGSLLSCIATACVLIAYVKYAAQQRSFRHALVLNLALAEFINTLNNSISGIWVLTHRNTLSPGTACVINGWVGQWSVQAADFCILAIAIVTLLIVTRKTYMPDVSLSKKVLICASVWILPTITATTAAGMQELQPVSGNWCWISSKRTDLRYALGHGWRFAIIFVTLGLYIYIWMHVRRHFRHLRIIAIGESESTHKSWTQSRQARLRSESQTQLNEISVNVQFELKQSKEESRGSPLKSDGERSTPTVHFTSMQSEPGNGSSKDSAHESPFTYGPATTIESAPAKPPPAANLTRNVEREIKKTLLLNAYPLLYIILWAPGLLNRLVEASGHKSRVLTIMQCSTQFVGLANAITYGLNEHLKSSVKRDLSRVFRHHTT